MLKSKLKQVTVTDANTDYNGSLTLDPDLMDAAELKHHERVEVNAVYGTARLVTYVIPGRRGSGQVEMNGGMANFFNKGDQVHVNCFANYERHEYDMYKGPIVVRTDKQNKIINVNIE